MEVKVDKSMIAALPAVAYCKYTPRDLVHTSRIRTAVIAIPNPRPVQRYLPLLLAGLAMAVVMRALIRPGAPRHGL